MWNGALDSLSGKVALNGGKADLRARNIQYQNQQDIKALTDVTKGIGINAKHICKILEMLKEQEGR